jgi:hypothetical protein
LQALDALAAKSAEPPVRRNKDRHRLCGCGKCGPNTQERHCTKKGGTAVCFHGILARDCDNILCNPAQSHRCGLCKRRKGDCARSNKESCPNALGRARLWPKCEVCGKDKGYCRRRYGTCPNSKGAKPS